MSDALPSRTGDARYVVDRDGLMEVTPLADGEQVEITLATEHGRVRLVVSSRDWCQQFAALGIQARDLLRSMRDQSNDRGSALGQRDTVAVFGSLAGTS